MYPNDNIDFVEWLFEHEKQNSTLFYFLLFVGEYIHQEYNGDSNAFFDEIKKVYQTESIEEAVSYFVEAKKISDLMSFSSFDKDDDGFIDF